jgi:hypothetical protein
VPFVVPGRPLRDVALHGDGRASLSLEDFTAAVEEAGGQVFDDDDEYVGNLAARVWSATAQDMKELAARLRVLRNPTLLGDLTPAAAAEALRDALPTVNGEVVEATAEALAESDATRGAFARDEAAAEVLDEFAEVWAGHVVAVVSEVHQAAVNARAEVGRAVRKHRGLVGVAEEARRGEREVREIADGLKDSLRDARAEHEGLLKSQDYQDARGLDALRQAQEATAKTRDSILRALWQEGRNASARAERLLADLGLLREDIDRIVAGVVAKEPDSASAVPLLTWTTRPRAIISVGDVVVDPGPDVSVTIDRDALRGQAQDWTDVAAARRARASDAQLALTDHARTVAPAEKELASAVLRVSESRVAADRIQQAHQRAEVAAREEAGRLLGRLRRWVTSPVGLILAAPSLPNPTGPATADVLELRPDGDWAVTGWSVTDVEELAVAEVSQIVVQVDEWRQLVQSHAVSEVSRHRTMAGGIRTAGLESAADARSCRAEANELRGGKLLALPRPGWINGVAARRTADPVAEELLLGSMLGWRDEVSDETERALIESALSASGVLGAEVTPEGADGGDWFVTADGDDSAGDQVTLASVLQVNGSGQRAEVASVVLGRIPLMLSAGSGSTGLTIGRDGSPSRPHRGQAATRGGVGARGAARLPGCRVGSQGRAPGAGSERVRRTGRHHRGSREGLPADRRSAASGVLPGAARDSAQRGADGGVVRP